METLVRCFNVEFPLSFHRARVVHANKYSEARGGAFDLPVSSTLHTDVVFRLADTNEDYQAYIESLDLPVYTDQEVTVICSGRTVVGYVDRQTNYYYYIVRNFASLFGIGLTVWWVFIATIIGGVFFYFINKDEFLARAVILFGCFYLLYLFQRWFINYRVRKAIDAALR
jgi:hypothetical protein